MLYSVLVLIIRLGIQLFEKLVNREDNVRRSCPD